MNDRSAAVRTGTARLRHVAIIMDGNGRWAQSRGLPRRAGHREGIEAARRAVDYARETGLRYLTVYSFSTENWKRPAGEVLDLIGLLRRFIVDDLPRLKEENIRLCVIGNRDTLPDDTGSLVDRAEAETASNDGFFLYIAFNYGGRDEIVRAVRKIAESARRGGTGPDCITEDTFRGFLDTSSSPDPDLVIRTGGERRVSNFLLWQAAYAEYVFLDVLWPDFTRKSFSMAVGEYYERKRRYGGLEKSVQPCP